MNGRTQVGVDFGRGNSQSVLALIDAKTGRVSVLESTLTVSGPKWVVYAIAAFFIVAAVAVVAIGAIDIWYCRSILREIDTHAAAINTLGRHDQTVDAVLQSHGLAHIAPDGATDVPNPE